MYLWLWQLCNYLSNTKILIRSHYLLNFLFAQLKNGMYTCDFLICWTLQVLNFLHITCISCIFAIFNFPYKSAKIHDLVTEIQIFQVSFANCVNQLTILRWHKFIICTTDTYSVHSSLLKLIISLVNKLLCKRVLVMHCTNGIKSISLFVVLSLIVIPMIIPVRNDTYLWKGPLVKYQPTYLHGKNIRTNWTMYFENRGFRF